MEKLAGDVSGFRVPDYKFPQHNSYIFFVSGWENYYYYYYYFFFFWGGGVNDWLQCTLQNDRGPSSLPFTCHSKHPVSIKEMQQLHLCLWMIINQHLES